MSSDSFLWKSEVNLQACPKYCRFELCIALLWFINLSILKRMFLEEHVCFLCADSREPLYRVCKCSTVVHETCMNELINRVPSHQEKCPVCTESYRIAIHSRKYQISYDKTKLYLFGSLTLGVSIIVSMSCYLLSTTTGIFYHYFAWSCIGVCVSILVYTLLRGKIFTCHWSVTRTLKIDLEKGMRL